MKCKAEMDNTGTSRIYKRARKRYLARNGMISCPLCPYHKWENSNRLQRSWKKLRRTQYKLKKGF